MTMVKPRNLCTLSLWDIASIVSSEFDRLFCTVPLMSDVPPGLQRGSLRLDWRFFRLHCRRLEKENILFLGRDQAAAWQGRLHLFALRVSRFARTVCRRAAIHLCCEVRSNQLVLFGSVLWVGTLGVMRVARHSRWLTAASRSFTDGPSACGCFYFIFAPLTFPSVELCRYALVALKNETATIGSGPNGMARSTVLDILYFDWSALYSCDCLFSYEPSVVFQVFCCSFNQQKIPSLQVCTRLLLNCQVFFFLSTAVC